MELSEMSTAEKKELLVTAIRTGKIPPSQYDEMLYMIGMIKIEPVTNVLDLENGIVLEDLILQWVKLIEREELAGVMSALRDCDDATRRTNLINRMIQKAFEHSQAGGLSEEE